MWAELIAAIFAVLALLFLPGYFIARSLGASRIFSLCLAPAISPGLYAVLGVLLYLTGIKADGFTVFLPLIVMSMLIYLVRLIRVKKGTSTTGAPLASHPMDSLTFQGTSWMPILYICTGILAGWYIFLSSLDTPLSCFQVYDNVFHLNYIRASFESGNLSILHAGQYLTDADLAISPLGTGDSFYPGGMHIVGALAMSLTGVGAVAAENALVFVFSSIVFPLAMLLLFDYLFKGNKTALIFGSFVALACMKYPWTLMTWGPVFANMAAYAFFPVVVVAIFTCFNALLKREPFLASLLLSVLGLISLGATQPNAIFFGFILFAAYTVQTVYRLDPSLPKTTKLFRAFILVFAYVLLWTALFYMPFFKDVIAFTWLAEHSIPRSLFNIATLALGSYPRQYIVALFMIIGFICTVHKPELRWLAAATLILCFIYFIADATDIALKRYLAGFWYNDTHRIAACIAIAAMPLIVSGLVFASEWIEDRSSASAHPSVPKQADAPAQPTTPLRAHSFGLASAALLIVFCVGAFHPTIQISNSLSIDSVASRIKSDIATNTTSAERNLYSYEEMSFVDDAIKHIPENALVLNVPDAGSILAYAVNGMRTYYRDFNTYLDGDRYDNSMSTENETSRTIRQHIDEVATNKDVQNALEEIGCEYVLILDAGDELNDRTHAYSFDKSLWAHIQHLDEKTLGFEVLLERDDMKLLHIQYEKQ